MNRTVVLGKFWEQPKAEWRESPDCDALNPIVDHSVLLGWWDTVVAMRQESELCKASILKVMWNPNHGTLCFCQDITPDGNFSFSLFSFSTWTKFPYDFGYAIFHQIGNIILLNSWMFFFWFYFGSCIQELESILAPLGSIMGTTLLHTYRCLKFSSAWGEVTTILGSIKIPILPSRAGRAQAAFHPRVCEIALHWALCHPRHGKTMSRRGNCITKNDLRKCEALEPCGLDPNLGFLLLLEEGCD